MKYLFLLCLIAGQLAVQTTANWFVAETYGSKTCEKNDVEISLMKQVRLFDFNMLKFNSVQVGVCLRLPSSIPVFMSYKVTVFW
jgi:hypothetical protein